MEHVAFSAFSAKKNNLKAKKNNFKADLRKTLAFFYNTSPALPIFECSPGLSDAQEAEGSEGHIFRAAAQPSPQQQQPGECSMQDGKMAGIRHAK